MKNESLDKDWFRYHKSSGNHQSIDLSNNLLESQSINHQTSQSVIQSINQSFNQTFNQTFNHANRITPIHHNKN